MASPPLPTDDNGFDWEAAVREIDSACQNASTSGSIQEDPARPPPAQPATAGGLALQAKPSGKPRQSTLDRFVDSFQKHARSGGRGRGRTPPVRENAPAGYNHADDDNVGDSDDAPAVQIDLEAAQTWIYPVNVPRRDYQFSIAKTALFSNTLVALPTGLGKTLIAAVVMYNYFRWFPEGKIVFTAPSRPLVMQQIEACHNIVGIPQEWTIDMTGQMSPPKRSNFWKSKRVFFVTPQVLEKDIQSGICLVKQLVCLVIDEAHRAMGNYAYCVAVRELMAVPVQLRILALTATPGSKQRTVQNVIDNLCISTLEYRNEREKDVSPYVHDRKIELVEVAMGKDAVEINNLLLEAIQPFVTRLCAIGVLYNKDFATLSPCELLNSRDKFRQAPPLNLPHAKYGEVEGYFGLLITLYHLRKLLSSHGIRPAYEMLKEKLEQGSFARLMRRNETIWKAKLLMHQSLSHGAPNPKLVKMIEILIDHFKEKDPRESRVIIFSNFRGSVKDIMSSLSSIRDFVRATEFIGQSSGKALKGQSQKVQQAVLQKFRSGGYNVIVATSIGEEGLDIVEVDLVICFDANVSPLRMIQRMGRTGRKHDGRVVVLACEGSELKGYLKKQASSKAVRKHMHNGGVKSFNFHSSPRMIPHICKPQVQFVELAIEQFVPRGKKLNDVAAHPSPYLKKVLDEESTLIARYFHSSEEDTWRPSLIAFPHFQAFPSGVHKVRHSFKTTVMLIDAMQHLQAVPCSEAKMASTIKDEAFSSQPLKDSIDVQGAANELPEAGFKDKTSDLEPSWEKENDGKTSDLEPSWEKENEGLKLHDLLQKPSHCFIFGGDFVTLNAFGSICISSVPFLPLKGHHKSEVEGETDVDCLENTRKDVCNLKVSGLHNHKCTQLKDTTGITISCEFRCMNSEGILESHTPKCDTQKQQQIETLLLQTPVCKGKVTASENGLIETPQDAGCVLRTSVASKSRNSSKNMDLSPRLTHFIEEGIVPESPVEISHHSPKLGNTLSLRFTPKYNNCWSKTSCSLTDVHVKKVPMVAPLCLEAIYDDPGMNESFMPCHVSPNITELSGLGFKEFSNLDKRETGRVKNVKHEINTEENLAGSPIHMNIQTPMANSKNNSSSEDWQINSDEAAKSVARAPKYKRLCRNRDIGKEIPCKTLKEKFNSFINSAGETATRTGLDQTLCKKGKKVKLKGYANSFIDEEVEVSEDAEVSEDEEDNENGDGYDDSFIDDRANPSEGSTREENSGCDMMAFYRRSLLTQSPLIQTCMTTSHDSVSPRTENGSSSLKIFSGSSKIFQDSAKQSSGMNSVTCRLHSEGVILQAEPSSSQRECSEKLESRKRKLNFQLDGSVPAEKMQSFQFEHAGKTSRHYQSETTEVGNGLLCDDDFYHGIDLDELEAEATKLLQYKSQLPIDNVHKIFHNNPLETKIDPSMNLLSSPSFDLGV